MIKKSLLFVLILSVLLFAAFSVLAELSFDRLSETDIKKVDNILLKLEPLIRKKSADGTFYLLTFEQLYAPLGKDQKAFLENLKQFDVRKVGVYLPYQGMTTADAELVVIKAQKIKVNGKLEELLPQFLHKEVYEKFTELMTAMEKDLGKRLYILHGYRSSAFQLFLFLVFLKEFDYSIRKTASYCSLPGYSEHGLPKRQAIDFINEDGICNDSKIFENLEEYKWLLKNAARFGFVLSYPKDNPYGIVFEPWHWRYEKGLNERQSQHSLTGE